MTDLLIQDSRHTVPIPPSPLEEEATGDYGPHGNDIDALIADTIAGDGAASGVPLMEDPQPRG